MQVETFYLSLRPRSKKERIQSLSVGSEDLYLASRWRTTKKDVAIVLLLQNKDIAAGSERSIVATNTNYPTLGGLFSSIIPRWSPMVTA